MNVHTTNIFGRQITIQDEELVMPKYSQIKGIVRGPSWLELFLALLIYIFPLGLNKII